MNWERKPIFNLHIEMTYHCGSVACVWNLCVWWTIAGKRRRERNLERVIMNFGGKFSPTYVFRKSFRSRAWADPSLVIVLDPPGFILWKNQGICGRTEDGHKG